MDDCPIEWFGIMRHAQAYRPHLGPGEIARRPDGLSSTGIREAAAVAGRLAETMLAQGEDTPAWTIADIHLFYAPTPAGRETTAIVAAAINAHWAHLVATNRRKDVSTGDSSREVGVTELAELDGRPSDQRVDPAATMEAPLSLLGKLSSTTPTSTSHMNVWSHLRTEVANACSRTALLVLLDAVERREIDAKPPQALVYPAGDDRRFRARRYIDVGHRLEVPVRDATYRPLHIAPAGEPEAGPNGV